MLYKGDENTDNENSRSMTCWFLWLLLHFRNFFTEGFDRIKFLID